MLCGHAARARRPAGRLDRRAFASVIAAFAPDEARPKTRAVPPLPVRCLCQGRAIGCRRGGGGRRAVVLCAGSKSSKLAVAWELFADGDKWDGALRRG